MSEIIPAILPKNYEDLKNRISLVRGVAPVVQIDICDGVYAKNTTWPFDFAQSEPFFDEHFERILNEQEGLPFWEDIDFELDLMISNALENFDIYTKLGPRRIIFHLEAQDIQRDLEGFKNFIEGIDNYVRDMMEIGVAINPQTPTSQIFPLINSVDFVQVMGIDHEAKQGEKFDPKCLEHIKTLREKFLDLMIAVDGAVNEDTAPALVNAGADRLVIGSAIFNTDDIVGAIERFREIV